MLATTGFTGPSTGSPLRYFSDADVERYMNLQKAVKSAYHGGAIAASRFAAATEKFQNEVKVDQVDDTISGDNPFDGTDTRGIEEEKAQQEYPGKNIMCIEEHG